MDWQTDAAGQVAGHKAASMFIAGVKDVGARNSDAAPVISGDEIVVHNLGAVRAQQGDTEGDGLDNGDNRNSAGQACERIADNHFI